MRWCLPRFRCASVVFGVAMIAFAPGLARAQGGVVTGVLVDTLTREPVAGAQVRASESTRGVVTDAAGRFRLTNLPGTTAMLVVTAVGYRPLRTVADIGSTNLRLEMTKVVVALDQLIVTGTAGEVERRAIGNSVTTLDAERQLELAPVPDVASLINGRAPGVLVMPGSGQVGAGPTIRARGVKSFSLNTNPLVYVDGVRVDNEIGSGISRVQGGSGVVNRLNDFSPEEIENIEIIKGPAAATLYGTEASNGVIQIITKRGTVNAPPKFALTVRQGATWFMNAEGRIAPNWAEDAVTRDTFSLDLFASERAIGNKIFGTGHLQGYTGSVRGGAETVRYFASADVDRDDGIEPTNYQSRLGVRGSLIITPSDKVEVAANLGLSRGHTQLACEGACGRGVWLSLIMGDPSTRDSAQRGFGIAPPEVLWRLSDTFQDLDRSQAALHFTHRPTAWFSHRLVVGEDRTHEDNQDIVRRDDSLALFPSLAAIADGQKVVNRRDVTMTTVDYSATSSVPLSRWADRVTSTTTLGMQYQHRLTRLVGATGNQFPAPGLETISSTASTASSDAFVENNTLGFFAQQQFSYRGRLYLTGALRADDNSAFGKNFDIVYYPKLSAAWVLHEEPWWRVPHFDALRVRFAYGAAGQQPQDFAALRSYAPVTAGTGAPAITPQFIGNDSLAPERGEEVEAGFEAAFLNQRIGVDFTYYAARTGDAILLRNLAPSLGFPGTQFVNAGEIRNHGAELQLRTKPYASRSMAVDLNLNLASNSNEVVDLGGIDDGNGFIQVPGPIDRQRQVPGLPVGAWFTRIVVSADLDSTGVARNVMCDGGTGPRLPNGEPTLPGGSPVPCDSAPALFVGGPFPNVEGALEAQATLFGRLRLYGLIDFKGGHKKLDATLRERCGSGLCREKFYPQEYDPRFIAEMQFPSAIYNWIIHDASFAKLRELSVSYAVPDAWARRIGASRALITVTGRNLHTWTRYHWLDPEAEFIEGAPNRSEFARQELAHVPQLAQFITTINITF